ncbi:rolling circle replication-associated protein [Sulfurospirillum diekertiae]|uniref:Replication-associated protein ORF2/G2P domain-containing protein n=1 Tax=Sulfurospirillum diekertiae TaxID=1854492 RepID=A0A1Y0HPX0_9BACT|nr:hypothetical protein [Sulfurospirillum diekertiae]ARU49414.1 hypothetical protein Sdiek1_2262 [Sulfurospirillum diekertiae]ASC94221.1 hypothetical protein Sdiek2_2213 [Sulfurospirillum diekertiae]
MKYGLNSFDVENSQRKIDLQKEYMLKSTFVTSNGTCKTLLDVNMNANISTRYYAQLVNKVNTLQQTMSNLDLMPIFMTLTLDGWLHDLYYGDYSRFKEEYLKKLPETDKYGYLKTKASLREVFDVHDLYMVLRWQWDRFMKTNTIQTIREDTKIGYLFAVEPHESGVPHAHVLFYVPFASIEKLKKEFKKIFGTSQNKGQDKERLSLDQIANGEMNGFQWTLTNPVGYILKYVTKSFMDIKNQSQIDELQAWYIKHRIVRFTTSHTLVPQWVYNKVYPLENDWLYLSDLKINSMCEWSAEDDYFKFEDTKLGKTLMYTRGLYQMFQDGSLVHEFGEMKELKLPNTMKFRDKFVLRQHKKFIKIELFNVKGQKIELYPKPIAQRKNYDLVQYYRKLNPELCNLQHFGLVQNECIKRGLIEGQIQSLNDFNTDFEMGA